MMGSDQGPVQLEIDIEPELRRRLEAGAAASGLSIRDYVVAVLRRAVATQAGVPARDAEWSRLSAPTFARDWEWDADSIYDDLA